MTITTTNTSLRTLQTHINHKPSNIDLSHVIVCAQRPLPAVNTWQADSIGNGVYYASCTLDEYRDYISAWSKLDATIVEYLTNEQIDSILRDNLDRDGISYDNALKIGLNRACDVYKLPHFE